MLAFGRARPCHCALAQPVQRSLNRRFQLVTDVGQILLRLRCVDLVGYSAGLDKLYPHSVKDGHGDEQIFAFADQRDVAIKTHKALNYLIRKRNILGSG